MRKLARLFFEMFRIALFVIGGGFAIIAVCDDVFSRKLKWTKEGELLDMLPLYQMIPGILAAHNAVYVGRGAWKTVDAVPPVFQTIYASVSPEGDVRQELSDDLQDMDDVSTVIFSDETINLYRNMLKVVDLIVVVLIVSAAALAFIVLYNLTNINVSERVREIASLKVLGFTRGEVYAYIFREIALLAVAGDAAGMLLGTWLAQFVITTAEVDYVMFGRTIHPPSYGYAFVLTLVFTGLVILFMRKKLDRVNMVESLKSVD